ncbi:exported hypothetical protein [Verrucomicrobia bacterium]|nr:exported hypothetical protein [Verrucomicrobiota bacterium]
MKPTRFVLLLVVGFALGLPLGWHVHSRSLAPTERLLPFWVELGKANESLSSGNDPTVAPLTLFDTNSRTLFYLESDGRHVSAIGADGKLEWCRDPFVDAQLQPYRFKKPLIHTFIFHQGMIGIAFDSTQFGDLDPKTGDFTFHGQD